MDLQLILMLVLIGLAAGILSGLVGVGGGIIIVPALVFFMHFSQQQAQGTSLGLLLLPVGFLAVWKYYQQGYVDIRTVLVMSVGFIVGGWLGSKLALSISQDILKKIFGIFLFYIAFRMLEWDKALINWIRHWLA